MINIILIVSLIVLYVFNLLRLIMYYQNDNYHFRFFKLIFFKDIKLGVLVYFLWLFLMVNKILSIVYISYCLVRLLKKYNIKYSKRIIRLLLIQFLILLTFYYLLKINFISYLIIINSLYIVINIVIFYISNLIEKILIRKYYKQATKRINKYNPFIIGITGSCGKTSIKNYMFECLKNYKLAYKTPKSYNTLNGITLFVNNTLKGYNNCLILEMGAAYKNDIKQITNIYKPNISIISEILPQHLATFKDMNTLITEKMNIIANMKEKGTIIVNNDNQNIKNNIEKYNIHNNKIIKIGLNMDNDIYAFDIKVSINSLDFKIYNSLSENTFEINSNLVGRHNIYNILIVFATLYELNIPEQEITEVIQSLQNHENRLEVKHFNNLTLLNDSYNSNQKGFMSALEILGLAKDKKIIITPGIVDSSKEINEYIAKEITRKCDFCYLISNKNIKYYINIFKQLNYNQYTIKKSFKDSFNDIKEEKATVLIENDLTDFYYL